MTIAIIGAMDEEVAYFQQLMSNKRDQKIAHVDFVIGTISNKDVVVLKSGIGKVNAAIATTILMEHYKPNFVINTGSAGGLVDTLQVGDIVIASDVVHHDVDVRAFGYEYGQVPQLPPRFKSNDLLLNNVRDIVEGLEINYEVGLIGTGDLFLHDPKKINDIKKKFPHIIAAEMEGAAIAQVCYQYSIPFIIIRALSDVAGKESSVSFNEFIHLASKNATDMIHALIPTLNSK